MKHRTTLRKPGIEIRKVLAGNVRALRSRLGISQEELAHLCGLHRTYVGAVERAERNVTLSTLEVFSKALGVSVPDLLTPRPQRYDKNT
jgi:transcriptional regulator with XRE-family HTH domain